MGMVENPVLGIQKYPEEKRDELKRLWTVLDCHPTHLTAFLFKFLLLTGAREGEARNATWDQFDLEKGIWVKPSNLTKQKKKEYLPLSEEALVVLQELKDLGKDLPYLFPGRVEGQTIQETKTFWRRVLRDA